MSDQEKLDMIYDELEGVAYDASSNRVIDYPEIRRTAERILAMSVPQWVKCSERMPDPCIIGYNTLVYDLSSGLMTSARYNKGFWQVSEKDVRFFRLITHWMYLPTPPQL